MGIISLDCSLAVTRFSSLSYIALKFIFRSEFSDDVKDFNEIVFLFFSPGNEPCSEQSGAIERRLVIMKKTSIPQGRPDGARGTPREPLIKRNQYIPNEWG